MKQSVLLTFFMVIVKFLSAQDPHFTQYFSTPSSLNPALAGQGIEDWRANGTYRSQWWGGSIAPYTTTSVSIDKAVYTGSSEKSNWGFGLSMLSDASNSGILKNNYFTGGAAYQIDLSGDGKEILGIGMSATYANRLLDASKFAFQDQFGSMGFQRSVPTADPVSLLNNHYWDVNAGVHFLKHADNWSYDLGAAVFHAGRPQEGVYNSSTYSLARRAVVHGNIEFQLGSKDILQISGISEWQGTNTIVTIGALYKVQVKSDILKSINVGVWNRFKDAICPYAGMENKKWLLGLSYDIVNSGIKTSYNSVQSLEVSFGWLFGNHSENTKTGFSF